MSWRCDLTGKKALVGHKVSHSNSKTKRRFLPIWAMSPCSPIRFALRATARVGERALKTVDHRGGLDAFLPKAKDANSRPRALELKRQIVKERAAVAG